MKCLPRDVKRFYSAFWHQSEDQTQEKFGYIYLYLKVGSIRFGQLILDKGSYLLEIRPETRKRYISRREIEIQKILESLEHDDFTTALKFGHQVKGNAKTFNFPDLEELAKLIEDSAMASDREATWQQLIKFKSQLELAKQKLN